MRARTAPWGRLWPFVITNGAQASMRVASGSDGSGRLLACADRCHCGLGGVTLFMTPVYDTSASDKLPEMPTNSARGLRSLDAPQR